MNGLFVLISIAVMSIGVTWIIASSILKVQRMRLDEARLRSADPAELELLAGQVSDLRQDLIDVQERLDFTERILAQVKDAPALPKEGS